MSLVRIAARIAAVEALKGSTLVGDNVLDSQIGALESDANGALQSDQEKPFVAVYTDAATTKDHAVASRAFALNGTTEFLFEMGITATHTFRDPDTEAQTVIAGVPATDAAFEFYMDVVARQIGDALTNPNNEWAELFRRMVDKQHYVERARASSADKVRLAGQQIKMVVDLKPDPPSHAPLSDKHPLHAFFAKVNAGDNASYKAQVVLMQAQIAGNDFEWQQDQRRYGMTVGELRGLLLDMQPGTEADIEMVDINTSPAIPVLP